MKSYNFLTSLQMYMLKPLFKIKFVGCFQDHSSLYTHQSHKHMQWKVIDKIVVTLSTLLTFSCAVCLLLAGLMVAFYFNLYFNQSIRRVPHSFNLNRIFFCIWVDPTKYDVCLYFSLTFAKKYSIMSAPLEYLHNILMHQIK